VAFQFGGEIPVIQRALRNQAVPGRCENVSHTGAYVLLIDYAHNEMSLKNLLETLREFEPERLVVLFGCGGNRSRLRRTRMGETAGRMADLTILTSDNPRWEEPQQILNDIEAGIKGTGGAYVRITDRREAVRYAVTQARTGDIIVLAGKGHEAYQEICGVKYPMSDYELAAEAIVYSQEPAEKNA
jgi:UDP-N-acetylmuramoyl-L-alanyl-D-glutamate--2,6-diaminopimelate ligase